MNEFIATIPFAKFDRIRAARQVVEEEANALQRLSKAIPSSMDEAIQLILDCNGAVIVTGIGKAGWIAQKISASLASTGTRSHFLHPAEAVHGDLGRIGPDDIVLMFSNSGETDEMVQLLPNMQKLNVPYIAIVGRENSTLAKNANVVLSYGSHTEACALNLAPSTTTTMMLALGDALALVTSQCKGFQEIDFAKYHPGGSLGLRLSKVDDIMRSIKHCRVAGDWESIREIYVRLQRPSRRTGAILLLDRQGALSGLFTDSDLARLLEKQQDSRLDLPIGEVMTNDPKTIQSGSETKDVIEMLAVHNISELPVVDSKGRPLGVVDITDVVALMPR